MYQKPSNNQFQKIFDRIAPHYDSITNNYAVSRRIDFFIKYSRGRCLEVGAGTGEVSKALIKNNHEVAATDISPKMVENIKRKLDIKAIVCDAEKLPFARNSFDTVVGAEMIYYLDHPEKFLSEASRVLKPEGRLLLSSTNNTAKIYDRIRAVLRSLGFKAMYFDDKNREFMSSGKLTHLLEEAGFKIMREKKIIILPFRFFDSLNRMLEKTFLGYLGIFILIYAKKPTDL